jgi:signal transduction histidine kinase
VTTSVVLLALAALALFGVAAILGGLRAASRCRAELVAPVHELRGAVTALQLGLSFAERKLRFDPSDNEGGPKVLDKELGTRLTALRGPLARAALAVEELDRCHEGGAWRRRESGEWIDLTALVADKARVWARMAPAYGARLELSWSAGQVELRGSAHAVARAFDNLLSNALEHGGRNVLVEGDMRCTTLRVVISDGGPGLAAVISRSGGRRASGRGYGLRIAGDIIAQHNGRLGTGMGARGPGVVVELPVRPADAKIEAPTRVRRGPSSVSAGMDLETPRAA